MENQEVVGLLREIRDLQKLFIEKQQEALKNQQHAIALQEQNRKRSSKSIIYLFVILILGLVAIIFPEFFHH